MQIKLSNNFEKNLYIIYEFISKDKLSAAQNFKKELFVFHIFNKNLPINIKKENENDSY